MAIRVSTQLGPSSLTLETGALARQADGAVVVTQGGTVVLVTAVCSEKPSPRGDFLALTCDYREKTYAAGRIPGGFFKREGRPTEKETLGARLMDRPIRPLFPKGFAHELQVIAVVLSSDGDYDPDVLALLGGSTALQLSSIPFPDPLAAVRVGRVGGEWIANPTYEQLTKSPIDLVVAGTKHGITMIESGMNEVPEDELRKAVAFGYKQVKDLIALQAELVARAAKPKNSSLEISKVEPELLDQVRSLALPELKQINKPKTKEERQEAINRLAATLDEKLVNEDSVTSEQVKAAFEELVREETRRAILDTKVRMDGRGYTDVREITCEIGVLPRTHGSGLFTRGQTQSLCVTTLGTSKDEQLIESLEGVSYRRFMLHYNFPPFSVGEVRPIRGAGRREIGHGALAERALAPIVPTKEEFPYTIRVVSEILESNGSSSMATVCASSLALMDCGVPVRSAVSGVAMGLVKEGERAAILTDITGLEDHIGDMDFKLAGTKTGTTALQVDVKLPEGISEELIGQILEQARAARMSILEKMNKVIERPRRELSVHAPRITVIKINPDKIRDVIGPGGRVIRKIIEETGASIDVEDDGSVSVSAVDATQAEKALETIRELTEEVEVGKIYNGKVKRIMNFGAFCEILPGKEGLVHVSELSDKYVKRVDDEVKIGDVFPVKVLEIDQQGRVNLSRKRARSADVAVDKS